MSQNVTLASRIPVCLLLAALVWGLGAPAQAYIDPTAAGAALQSAYLVAASALMSLALVPRKVAGAFHRFKQWLSPDRQTPGATPPDGENG